MKLKSSPLTDYSNQNIPTNTMTARQGISFGEPDLFIAAQSTDAASLRSQSDQAEESEMAEAMSHLFGGVSGLLFALSLGLFLQAPFVSAGVLLTLCAGWTGRAVFQARQDSPRASDA